MASGSHDMLEGRGLRIAVIASRFNAVVADRLLAGALAQLAHHGVERGSIDVIRVPGAFEIPGTAALLARAGKHDAIVCLGAVIRGETPHFDFVAGEAARGIADAARSTNPPIPVLFGVLTTDTMEQAMERSGGKHGNKGAEAAAGAVEMANLYRRLGAERKS